MPCTLHRALLGGVDTYVRPSYLHSMRSTNTPPMPCTLHCRWYALADGDALYVSIPTSVATLVKRSVKQLLGRQAIVVDTNSLMKKSSLRMLRSNCQ